MKKQLQKVLRAFDIGVYRVSARKKHEESIRKKHKQKEWKRNEWLRGMQIKTILDIGANDGHFARKIRSVFPEAFLYSFEPLPEPYAKLCESFSNDRLFRAFDFALGKQEEALPFFANDFSPSSSFLPMQQTHKDHFDFTKNETVRNNIQIKRLDSIVSSLNITYPLLVKIDVQGFEKQVIEGGVDILKQAAIIIMELSFKELYVGAPLFDEMYQQMKDLDFQYSGSYEQLYSPVDGSILQCDGIFIKRQTTRN